MGPIYCANARLPCIARVFPILRAYSLYCARILGNVHSILGSTVLRVYSWQSTLYVDFMETGHDNFTRRLFSNLKAAWFLVAWKIFKLSPFPPQEIYFLELNKGEY